jgi:hypothetical protein
VFRCLGIVGFTQNQVRVLFRHYSGPVRYEGTIGQDLKRRSRIPGSTARPFLVPFITSQGLWTGMSDLLGPVKHNATAARVVANSSQAMADPVFPRTLLTPICVLREREEARSRGHRHEIPR